MEDFVEKSMRDNTAETDSLIRFIRSFQPNVFYHTDVSLETPREILI
jgi:hypothetical protein